MKKNTPYAIRRISTVWSNIEERDWEYDAQGWIIAFRERPPAEAYAEELTRKAELGSAESWREYQVMPLPRSKWHKANYEHGHEPSIYAK